MRKIIKTIILTIAVSSVYAQQIPLTSQYMFNNYLLNPAEAGSQDCLVASLSARSQWTGLEGAPTTQFFSMHTKFGEKMGVGGYVFNDETGPVTDRGIQLSYTYHLNVSDNGKLSFGIAGMLFSHMINRASFRPEESGDDALNSLKTNAVSPDINFGMMYYTEKLKVGFSAPQLLQNNMYGTFADANNLNNLTRHYYIFGEYTFDVNEKFDVAPSTLLKYVQGAPFQFDINVKGIYDEKYWLGVSYRYNNAIAAMVGLNIKSISVGYSYDYSSTDLNNFSSGGHEIFLSAKLFKKEEPKSNMKFN